MEKILIFGIREYLNQSMDQKGGHKENYEEYWTEWKQKYIKICGMQLKWYLKGNLQQSQINDLSFYHKKLGKKHKRI